MRTRRCLWLALALLAPIGQARAEMVRDWRNAMHYPARVMGVHWDNGRLDARSSVRFGAWTVSFGPPVHFALYFQFPDGTPSVIAIGGDNPDVNARTGSRKLFHCSSAAVGGRLCSLSFHPGAGRCQLLLYTTRWVADTYIDISCPNALDLAR